MLIDPYRFRAPPSTWNPLDVAASSYPAPNPTFPGVFSNGNLALQRNSIGSSIDPACRGVQSRGTAAELRYLEVVVTSCGTIGASNNPYLSFGLLDNSVMTGSDMAKATGHYLIIYGNGAVYKTGQTSAGTLGAALANGDVVGLVWVYGTEVRIYVNNVLKLTAPFTDAVTMWPFFGCGSTLVGGPDLANSGETLTLHTNSVVFTYSPPAGVAWG